MRSEGPFAGDWDGKPRQAVLSSNECWGCISILRGVGSLLSGKASWRRGAADSRPSGVVYVSSTYTLRDTKSEVLAPPNPS